ncbi:MAG: histidine kinase, partial [Chitinophagaceae bacterium]
MTRQTPLQSRAGEAAFLLLLTVLIPAAVGLQVFDRLAYTLCLVGLSMLHLPSLLLLYKYYLPQMLLRRRYGLLVALLPVYIFIYELNARLSYYIYMRLPFIPAGYREKLQGAHFDSIPPLLIQNLDYTLLILLAAAGFLFMRDSQRRQQDLAVLQADKWRLELESLQAQVQPHFFFNTLNNLYALSLQASPRTPVMIAHLSGIMRYVLYEARNGQVPLAKEIAFLHSYLDLERIRHEREDAIRFAVQGRPEGHLVEPLLFLPLVENCFKHSLQQAIPGNSIELL